MKKMNKTKIKEKKPISKKRKIIKIVLITLLLIILILFLVGLGCYLMVLNKIKDYKVQQQVRENALKFVEEYTSEDNDAIYLSDFEKNYEGNICKTVDDTNCVYFRNGFIEEESENDLLSAIVFYYNENGYTISTDEIGTSGGWLHIKEAILNYEFKDNKISITTSGEGLDYPPVGN